MGVNEGKLLHQDEVFQIVGCAIEVLSTLGHGLLEKAYENALVVEFGLRKTHFASNRHLMSCIKDHKIGLFVPDLIAFDSIVVDTKVIEAITDHEHGLMLNICASRDYVSELVLNFKNTKLEWERLVS